jgi:hypothetical protein
MATLKRPDDTRAQREMDAIEFDVEALLNGPRPDDPATAAAWRDRRRQVFEHLTGHPTLDPRCLLGLSGADAVAWRAARRRFVERVFKETKG